MANIFSNVFKKDKQNKGTKTKKPLKAIGMTLFFEALIAIAGFLLLGSLAFLFNAVTVFAVGDLAVAAGIGAVKGINFLKNKSNGKTRSKTRGLERERTQTKEQERENNLETIPEVEEEEEFEVEVLPREQREATAQPAKSNKRI